MPKYISIIADFLSKLNWSTLFVGIIVPIAASWGAFLLAENATKRKEMNKLNIQIELLRQELDLNRAILIEYLCLLEDKKRSYEKITYPLIFMQDVLIHIFDDLERIKREYFRFGTMIYECPNICYQSGFQLEEIEKEISDLESKSFNNVILEQNRIKELALLEDKKKKVIKNFKDNSERVIYTEFIRTKYIFDNEIIAGNVDAIKEDNLVGRVIKELYKDITEFLLIENKTKEDVIKLYDKIPIFDMNHKELLSPDFNEEDYEFFDKTTLESKFGKDNALVDACKYYFDYKRVMQKEIEFCFEWHTDKWVKYKDEMVLLGEKYLYIGILELYENKLNEILAARQISEKKEFKLKVEIILKSMDDICCALEQKQKKIEKNIR